MNRRSMFGASVALATTALLAGCSLTRPAPVKEIYLLQPEAPQASTAPPVAATLRVSAFNVAAPYRERTVVVRDAELKYQADYYREYLVAPAAMIGEATQRALTSANVYARVLPNGSTLDADYVLEGFVESLYADARDPRSPAAELAIAFFLARADRGGIPLWSKAYSRRIPFSGTSADAYIGAQNRALTEILAELARDLRAVQYPAR